MFSGMRNTPAGRSLETTNPLDALMVLSMEGLNPYISHCFDDGFVKMISTVPGLDMCKQQVSQRASERVSERHIWRAW